MWRALARRALLNRRTAAPELRSPVLHPQVSHHESVTIVKPASHFSFSSSKSHFHQSPRFFSSNPSMDYEDSPSPDPKGSTTGIDFSGLNQFDDDTKLEAENEEFIFDDVIPSLEGNDDIGVSFGSSVGEEDGNFGSVEVGNEGVGVLESQSPHLKNIESFLSLLQSCGTGDGSLESNLGGMSDLVLDEDLLLKVLETPSVRTENLITFFRWALKKLDFKVTTQVLDLLVGAICRGNKTKDVYALWDLVKKVGEKENGVVSTQCLNGLITKFSHLGKGKAAFEAFNKFEELGCHPNEDSYYFTIEALCKRSFYEWACSVCEKMINADKLPNGDRVGNIISYLCKGGQAKDAHLVYVYAKDKKIHPPRSSMDVLITSLCRIERAEKGNDKEINKELEKETVSLALEMLGDYSAEDRKTATESFLSVIKKLCWIEDVGRAKKLLLEMIDMGTPPGNATFNYVINGLAKVGEMDEALKVMKLIESRGLKPDLFAYSVIISGYARKGLMEEACKIFDEAKKKHSKLQTVIYHSLIRGFCKLEQFDKAVSLLGEMKQHGVMPSHDEYNKLIKSLCMKALDWETAQKLQEDMKLNGLILNGRTSALISAVKELKEGGVNAELPAPT